MHLRSNSNSGAWGVLYVAGCACALSSVSFADLPMRVAAGAGLAGFSAPGVPGGTLSVIGAPQIDDDGAVLATCRVQGPDIAYAVNDLVLVSFDRYGHGRLLGRTGVTNTTGLDGTAFSATFFPRLGKDGSVASVGFLSGTGVDPTNSTGYWRGNKNLITPSLRSGQPDVPGVPSAVFYGFVGGFPCVISHAGVAFNAQLAVGTGGVTINDYQGLWGPSSGGGVGLVARPGIFGAAGSPPTSLPGAAYAKTNPKSLVLADNGSLVFQATLAIGPAGVSDADDTVIVERHVDGSLAIAAREGQSVPGHPGMSFKSFDTSAFVPVGGTSMNGSGWIVFGDIDGANPPITGLSHLWRRNPSGGFDLLATRDTAAGQGAPVGIGGTFTTILAPAMNGAGTAVFAGTVLTPTGVQVAGMWAVSPAGETTLLAASGVANSGVSPPGSPGAVFSIDPPARGTYRINSRGQIVFKWKLEDGVGSVTTSNDDGMWAWDPAAGLLKVCRTGDTVTIGGVPQTIRSVNPFLGPGGDDDGRIMDVNALGEVACVVQFTDNTGAILVVQLPGSGACCRGATCSIDSSAACSGLNTRFAGIGTVCASGPLASCCFGDFDQSGTLDTTDIFAFIDAWFVAAPGADVDHSGSIDSSDVLTFINVWYLGC